MEASVVNHTKCDKYCEMCGTQIGQYCCPRCSLIYCSISCYRADRHLECTEQFYKEQVELNISDNTSEVQQRKMLEMLQRNRFSDSSDSSSLDSDDDEPLEERLKNIDLNDTRAIWQKLSREEKDEFKAILKSEDISDLVPYWTAWWQVSEENSDLPKLSPSIKDLKSLTSKQPAECVKYNIANVIGAYTFMARYFNGEHQQSPKEGANCIWHLSKSLKVNENFTDIVTAVKSIELECHTCESVCASPENLSQLDIDIRMIFKGDKHGTSYVLYALSDARKLFDTSLTLLTGSSSVKRQWQLAVRKLDYYLAYAKGQTIPFLLLQ